MRVKVHILGKPSMKYIAIYEARGFVYIYLETGTCIKGNI